jgi:CRP-like cAMP-binding protein
MTLDEEVSFLRAVPLFSKIDANKLKLLAFTSERLEFAPGDVLFEQGEAGTSAYVILKGEADVLVQGTDGLIKVATLHQYAVVGEIAMLCDVPRTATVKAATELTALKVSRDVFLRLVHDFPDMGVEMMRELARRLEETTKQLREAKMASGA